VTPLEWIGDAAWTSIPVVGMSIFVWWLFRSLIRADATERKTYANIEAEERAKLANADGEQAGSKGK
jgi:hypothetical protein